MNPLLYLVAASNAYGECVVKDAKDANHLFCPKFKTDEMHCKMFPTACSWIPDSGPVVTTTTEPPTESPTESPLPEDGVCCTLSSAFAEHDHCVGADLSTCVQYPSDCLWTEKTNCILVAPGVEPTKEPQPEPTKKPKPTVEPTKRPTRKPRVTTTTEPKLRTTTTEETTTEESTTTEAAPTAANNSECYPCRDFVPASTWTGGTGTDWCESQLTTGHNLTANKCDAKGKIYYPSNNSEGDLMKVMCAETCHKHGIKMCPCGEEPPTTTTTTTTTTTSVPVHDDIVNGVLGYIDNMKPGKDGMVLRSYMTYKGHLEWLDSKVYLKQDLKNAVAQAMLTGVGDNKLFNFEEEAGGDKELAAQYAATAIAAFIGQAMSETIYFDACDENNWDYTDNGQKNGRRYRGSASCGQAGQVYSQYVCDRVTIDGEDVDMTCPEDPSMALVGNTHAPWWGAPPPMFCGPKEKLPKHNLPEGEMNDAMTWNPYVQCQGAYDPSVHTPVVTNYNDLTKQMSSGSAKCFNYEGQLAGIWEPSPQLTQTSYYPKNDKPVKGKADVEGCCWWGRGVIQTTGRCNFGKLNYYVGKRAFDRNGESLYPDIDFCKNPQAVCSGDPTLKWFAGFFYWMMEVQSYDGTKKDKYQKFDFKQRVMSLVNHKFDDDELQDFTQHISAIVNRGCSNPDNIGEWDKLTCGTDFGHVLHAQQRYWNTKAVITSWELCKKNGENCFDMNSIFPPNFTTDMG